MQKIAFIVLPIFFFLYNAIETGLKLSHSSLCHSTGCLFADNLLRFDSLYLNYIGVAVSLLIMILGWLSYHDKVSKKFFYLVLFVSLLFETIMLGYQYFVSPEMCKFCMGVYAFLWAIMITASGRYAVMALSAVLALVTALSFLAIPKTAAFVVKNGTYLIQSPTCPHCKKVKTYFKENDINFTKLDINSPEAKNFATFLNFSTIPIMIVKKDQVVEILNGDEAIIDSFSQKESESQDTPLPTTDDLFNINGSSDKEGCGFFSIDKQEDKCESEQ